MTKNLRFLLPLLGLMLFVLAYNVWVLDLFTRWWYADDPYQIYYTSIISNPLHIFTNPQILHDWGSGNAMVPFQLLSYWLDTHLFGTGPFPAYGHNVVALLLTSTLLYSILWKCTGRGYIAFGATLIWLLLPSTLAVHQFISTRHYMEGLLFGLALSVLSLNEADAQPRARWPIFIMIGGLGIISMLYKEIFATTVPTFLFLMGVWRRRPAFSVMAVVLTLIYAAYRLLFLGGDVSYTMDLVGPLDYLSFLSHIPYMITASPTGYVLYLGFLLLMAHSLWPNGRNARWPALVFLALMGATLLALYPVTWAVQLEYQVPETWYRVPFLINTLLVIYAARLIRHQLSRPIGMAALALVLFLLLPAAEITRLHWETITTRAEAEGIFYIHNPDKLLYSEEDAAWFLYGVDHLYDVPTTHYIPKNYFYSCESQELISQYETIWRYDQGRYIADDDLYQNIIREHAQIATLEQDDTECSN